MRGLLFFFLLVSSCVAPPAVRPDLAQVDSHLHVSVLSAAIDRMEFWRPSQSDIREMYNTPVIIRGGQNFANKCQYYQCSTTHKEECAYACYVWQYTLGYAIVLGDELSCRGRNYAILHELIHAYERYAGVPREKQLNHSLCQLWGTPGCEGDIGAASDGWYLKSQAESIFRLWADENTDFSYPDGGACQ